MYSIEQFPPEIDFETVAVLKKLASAHRYLAELKGICRSIPNQGILINTLSLQEAKDSSEIENIITNKVVIAIVSKILAVCKYQVLNQRIDYRIGSQIFYLMCEKLYCIFH